MYGLSRCGCGGTVYHDDTGRCDDCTNDQVRDEYEGRIRALERVGADLEALAAARHTGSATNGALGAAPPGRFRLAPASDLTRGDRLFDPAAAVLGYSWSRDDVVAVELAGARGREYRSDHPLLVWRPDDPFRRCHECTSPLFMPCSRNCPADEDRQRQLDRARTPRSAAVPGARPFPQSRALLEAPYLDAAFATACIVAPVLRPANAGKRHDMAEAMFARLEPAFARLAIPIDLSHFDIDMAKLQPGACDTGLDLTAAAGILLAADLIESWRLDSTVLWAQIQPDGTLTSPTDSDAQVATWASTAGYDRLVTASSFAAAPGRDCRHVRLRDPGELLTWAGRAEW